jgi:hypothetical protein
MARCGLALASAALVVSAWCSSGVSADASPQLTVIGDSVLTAVIWNQAPLSVLESGFDVNMQVGVCRTLTGVSCPFNGTRVPTLVDLVHTLGPQLGPNVVVEVGYNDPPDSFEQGVEQAITALLGTGVQRIFWVNLHLHAWHPQYAGMNRVLDAAARRHPQVTILDWRSYTINKWPWFQSDGIHLTYAGAMAMATFLNSSVAEALSPLAVSFAGPTTADVGRLYEARLSAAGGIPPYRFSETGVPLRGLRLTASGHLYGRPTHGGKLEVPFQVTDSFGYTATRPVILTVRQPNP